MRFLEVEKLSKHFGGIAAIEDLTFQLNKGEILGLIGPNGAGKTTLFNLITGFLSPNEGEIRFKGVTIQGLKPYKIVQRGITKTFQIPKPIHSLSCFENIVVSLISNFKPSKGGGKLIEKKAQEILDNVGLIEKSEMLPGILSQGDVKHLEVARALATEPELLLLDEPFAGLSIRDIENLTSIIHALNKKGITIIIVEHKLRALMKIVKRVMVLNFGVRIADGTPEEVTSDRKVIGAYLGSEGFSIVST